MDVLARFDRTRVEALGTALFLGLLAAFATWPASARLDLFEDGTWLGPANAMLQGRAPYRETFPIHGFLADGGIDVLLYRFTGPSFSASVWARQAIGCLFLPALYLVTAVAARRPRTAAIVVLLGLLLAPDILFDRGVVALLGLAVFLFGVGSPPRSFAAAAAGAIAVVGVLYSLDFGMFVLAAEMTTAAVAAIVARNRPRIFDIRAYLAGLAGAAAVCGAALAAAGALAAFLRTSFLDLPRVIGGAWGLPFPTPWTLAAAWRNGHPLTVSFSSVDPIMAARLYAVPATTLIAAILLWRARERLDPASFCRALALVAANLFFFRYVYGRLHYEAGNALGLPAVFAAWTVGGAPVPSRRRAVRAGESVVTALACLGAAISFLGLWRPALRFRERIATCPDCVRLDVPRGGGARVLRQEAADLTTVCAAIQRLAPKGPIFDLSNRPGLYFFLDRPNPTRFYQVPIMERFQDEAIRDLSREPPAIVLFESETYLDDFDGRSNPSRVPKLWSWVSARYPHRVTVGRNVFGLPVRPPDDSTDRR